MTAQTEHGKPVTELAEWVKSARKQTCRELDLVSGPRPLPAHVGLWLDRCYWEPSADQKGQSDGDKPGRRALYRAAIAALRLDEPSPPAIANYRRFFARWEAWTESKEPGILRRSLHVEAKSRILLHPATGSTVTEGGLLLHHTYGVPCLPGSALKGIARSRALAIRNRFSDDGRYALFGFEKDEVREVSSPASVERRDEAGAVDFCDALWIPEPPSGHGSGFSPLALDLVNPHHASYYTESDERPAPLESDDPVPTLLLSIRPGARFLIVLEVADFPGRLGTQWMDWIVDELLLPGLEDEGIGARTRAGYGRLELVGSTGKAAQQDVARHSGRATVTYQRGNGELRAQFADRKVATVRGEPARTMLMELSDGTKAKLNKGKAVSLMAQWEPHGNARKLVALSEP